jgi:hypothetical protein
MITRTIYKTRLLFHKRITEYLNRLDKTQARINSNPHIIVKAITVRIKAKSEIFGCESLNLLNFKCILIILI